MRFAAWFLLVITICVGALIAYSLYAAELEVVAEAVTVVPAVDMLDRFEELKQAAQERALLGTQFQEERIGDPTDYEFHIYNVRLRNNGLIPADWVRLDVHAEAGDILQAEAEGVVVLKAVSAGELNAVVLAQRGSSAARNLSLTYFIWSRLYNIPVQVRQ